MNYNIHATRNKYNSINFNEYLKYMMFKAQSPENKNFSLDQFMKLIEYEKHFKRKDFHKALEYYHAV